MQEKHIPKHIYPITKRRLSVILLAFLLLASYLLFTVFRMQVFGHREYARMVKEQISTATPLLAERGSIYDRNGELLASSKTVWRVYLSPVDIRAKSKEDGVDYASVISDGLSKLLDVPYDTVFSRAKKSNTIDQTVKRLVEAEDYRKVLDFIEREKLHGMVNGEASVTRYYPYGSLAAHVLGFTGSDQQGLFGLEYEYDELLRGTNGSYLHAKDATGKELPGVYLSYQPAVSGHSIQTTLDSFIQNKLETTIDEILHTFDVKNRVTGIVMNVKTGAVLAMATSSPFDLNDPYTLDPISMEKLTASGYDKESAEYKRLKSELLYEMWRNKATSELYEPGSTFKILTSAMALDLGAVSENDRFSCTGSLRIGGYNISCHKHGGHGSGFTFAYGLQQSCNPTLMQIGARIGAERFYDYFEAFGFFEETGIDLPSEVTALFHKKDAIGTTELATASFGQRFKVSILQLLTAVSAVANGGELVTPYLVETISDSSGNTVFTHQTEVKRRVISTESAAIVSKILEAGVSGDGGARNAYVDGYKVAAKTGTSQKFDILDENGNSYLRIGSCVAFAPSDNAEIAAIIVVDEPSTAKYGAVVAAPYVGSLLDSVLPYLEAAQTGEKRAEIEEVPALVGLTVSQVRTAMRASSLSYTVIGNGTKIVSQFPSEGIPLDVSRGRLILYTDGAESQTVSIPSLIGLSPAEANEKLAALGLNVAVIGLQSAPPGSGAAVTAQSLAPGTQVPLGSVVRITVIYPNDRD